MSGGIRKSDCPINLGLEIFGDRWALLILRDIIFFNHRHFNEFVSNEGISTNILADRLNKLVHHKILIKEKSPTNQSSFLYSLTQKGLHLVPTVLEIYHWGAKYIENNNADKEIVKRIDSDKNKVLNTIMTRLKREHNLE